jgi:ubiquinone/menaquinone biosynthesis C-methylase UbiE
LKKSKKPNQEEVWDNIAGLWSEYRQRKIPIVEEFLKGKKGMVIDLGCGNGRNMAFNSDIEYYGVDISKEQLRHAEFRINKNKIKAILIKGSIDKLNKNLLKDNMFDYGLFIATLHCIETKKKRKESLKEFYRVLKKGGEGLISVWNSEDKRFDCVGNNGNIYMSWRENNIDYMRYYYLFRKQEFLDLIESIGFDIIKFYEPREHDRFSRKNWIVRVRK